LSFTFGRTNFGMKHFIRLLSLLCVTTLCSCEGDQTVRYKFTGLDLQHIHTSSGLTEVFSSDSIQKELYGLRLNLHPVETFRKGRYFDPYEAPAQNENPVHYIFITSDKAMDVDHTEGSLLNGNFIYFPGNYNYCRPLPEDSTAFYITADYLPRYPDNNFPDYADLLLINYPDSLDERKFFVRIVLYDGTEFSDSTSTIKLY